MSVDAARSWRLLASLSRLLVRHRCPFLELFFGVLAPLGPFALLAEVTGV